MTSAFERSLSTAWPVRHFDTVESTNTTAHDLARGGDCGPCWVLADTQISGRGRLGRQWRSQPGNLYATALFVFEGSLETAPQMCFCAGLAVHDAVAATTGVDRDLRLKWPNDVKWQNGKISGVLIESTSVPGVSGQVIACGFGVNIVSAPETEQATACLSDMFSKDVITNTGFIEHLDLHFRQRLQQWCSEGFERTRRDWLARAEGLGARIGVTQGASRIYGVFEDLDNEGNLLLRDDNGETVKISAGDVQLMN